MFSHYKNIHLYEFHINKFIDDLKTSVILVLQAEKIATKKLVLERSPPPPLMIFGGYILNTFFEKRL